MKRASKCKICFQFSLSEEGALICNHSSAWNACVGAMRQGSLGKLQKRQVVLVTVLVTEICNEKNQLLGCEIAWFCQFSAQTFETDFSDI